jgi:phosphoglycerol transferase
MIPFIIITLVYAFFLNDKFKDIYYEVLVFNHKFKISVIPKKLILFGLIVFISSLCYTCYNIGVPQYLKNNITRSSFIEENYVKPENIEFKNKKKNLIHIYIESFESSYVDNNNGGYEDYNLIPNLSNLKGINFSHNDKFGGMLETYGTTWTVAALVSQTSGIPLNIPIEQNLYNNKNAKFLSGAISIGDILEENGYSNNIIFGSDAIFGGRKQYFEQHGSYNISDSVLAIEKGLIPEDYDVWWGHEDGKLFEYAKEEISNIAKEDSPFNYTILTVNTHFPDGYTEPFCDKSDSRAYANSIKCSDTMINDFLKWLKKQDFYKDTVVVITGDHLSMDKEFFKSVDKNYTRTVYNMFLNTGIKNANNKNRLVSSFDIFPTTLALLGATWEGDRLALGTNLFSDSKTLFEEYGYEYVNEELKRKSIFYNKEILGY